MRISPETYSAWSNNSSTRALSSSGGLYSEIAKHLLEQGYAVVGARYKEDCTVEHDIILVRRKRIHEKDKSGSTDSSKRWK